MNILILNRWSDEFSAYDKYIDHDEHRVTYIVNPKGRAGIENHCKSQNRAIYEVPDLGDFDALCQQYRQIEAERGKIDRILTLSEYDLTMGGMLRTEFGVTGHTRDQVRRFKDKVAMKAAIIDAGLRAPRFCQAESNEEVLAFAEKVGYPVILKPRQGAASVGVSQHDGPDSLISALETLSLSDYECEEFIQGSIYHVDGLQSHGENAFRTFSKYINTCFGYAHGTSLGSFMVDDPELIEVLGDFTDKALRALDMSHGPYHLELFLKDDKEVVFLEIGARVGGGEIPNVIKDLYGIDLIREWIRIELDEFQAIPPAEGAKSQVGGFILVPTPQEELCRVVTRTSLLGELPTLYEEILPPVGSTLSWNDNTGYEKIGGRFRFRGETSAQVEADIIKAIDTYKLEYEVIPSNTL